MLLPDNIHPEQCIYYNGAFVLKEIQEHRVIDFLDLYLIIHEHHEMTMPIFVMCLDWLFLLNLVTLTNLGEVELCS